MKELQAIVRSLLDHPEDEAVLATLVAVEGSSYRRPGARLLLRASGERIGSISGGCLEEDVIARAKQVMQTGIADVVVYDTTSENDLVWGVGLGCHGVVRVLLERVSPHADWVREVARNARRRVSTRLAIVHDGAERAQFGTSVADPDAHHRVGVFVQTIPPPLALFVFGAGDDARPLARLAKELGWVVTVVDPRPAFATPQRFPEADRVVIAAVDALPAEVTFDRHSMAVVMTHHYVHDLPLIQRLLHEPLAYLGLLGPRKRADKILDDIIGTGADIPAAKRARLHAPVGLDIGADGPEQVALSIVAEIQATLNGRNARPLRERQQPIHAAIGHASVGVATS
jgi:xanthine/CO dehydrogenase XdhC/CoxF family maturation factor